MLQIRAKTALLLLLVGMMGGCVQQAPVFSWYHPLGGEYLFAYDSNACETDLAEQGVAPGTDLEGPFFQCMHERGYFLVDANGIVQAPANSMAGVEQQVSQQ